MWILESELFDGALYATALIVGPKVCGTWTKASTGKKLWLRPGKTYLFGRTVAEGMFNQFWIVCATKLTHDLCLAGQLTISDKTVSRKHLTIHIDNVPEGGGVCIEGVRFTEAQG